MYDNVIRLIILFSELKDFKAQKKITDLSSLLREPKSIYC